MDLLTDIITVANELFEKKLYTEILNLLTEKVLKEANVADLYILKGRSYNRLLQHDKAIDDLTHASVLNPQSAEAFYYRGFAWHQKKEFQKAIDDYSKAILLNPELTDVLLNRGNLWHENKEIEKALGDYSEAIRLKPDFADAFVNRGIIWQEEGEIVKALEDYSEAIRFGPNLAEAYYNRGRLWQKQNEIEKSLKDYSEAIQLKPDFAEAYNNRGNAWKDNKDFDKAIEDYSQAIKLNPIAKFYHNRGNAWKQKKEFDKAITDLSEALRLNPEYAEAFDKRATVWIYKGEYNNAIDDLNKAILFDRNLTSAHLNLGMIHLEQGNHSQASCHYKRAFFLKSDSGELFKVFAQFYVSPFILQEILNKLINKNNLSVFSNEIMAIERDCEPWQTLLFYLDILRRTKLSTLDYYRLKAIVNFHMGHSINTFLIYKKQIKETDLSLQDRYYFALSAADFFEPNHYILKSAKNHIETMTEFLQEELYYAGQLYRLDMKFDKAKLYFQKAGQYLPALLGLIGLPESQQNVPELQSLIPIIKGPSSASFQLLDGITPINLQASTTYNSFASSFRQRLFYYELQQEIDITRGIIDPELPYDYTAFCELIELNSNFKRYMENMIEARNIRVIEKDLITGFTEKTKEISIEDINKQIANNNDAKSIILRTEQNSQRFETSAEKELAIAISKLEEPAEWYILLIKYFFRLNKLSGRSAVILNYYTLKIAQHKKDKVILDNMTKEIKSWTRVISTAFDTPALAKIIIKAFMNIRLGKSHKTLDQFKDYQEFKRKFRTDYLAWWIEDVYGKDLVAESERSNE